MNEETLVHARRLVETLEHGDEASAVELIEGLALGREQTMFQELGKLTRELHDALKGFQLDSRITSLAEQDIPDAKDRLNYVITMTEQAAHRTLNAVEQSLPVTERLQRRAVEVGGAWERFLRREMDAEEFRQLSRELSDFFKETADDGARVHGDLSDVLMAQDFQDITGQVIRRVIKLVQDVEDSLVEIIRISGRHLQQPAARQEEEEEPSPIEAVGPAVPGVDDNGNVVSGQDEVDDLLASLGF